jgi:hypothetical protein
MPNWACKTPIAQMRFQKVSLSLAELESRSRTCLLYDCGNVRAHISVCRGRGGGWGRRWEGNGGTVFENSAVLLFQARKRAEEEQAEEARRKQVDSDIISTFY